MRITTILNPDEKNRKTAIKAKEEFIKSCKIKNLTQRTIDYYEEDINQFLLVEKIKYIDEITKEVVDDFIVHDIDKGNKKTSINARLRGLRVFFNYCIDQEYIDPIKIALLKVDSEIKEPYTESEIWRLLAVPKSNKWTEWRTWAVINYLVATGNRISTVVNLKIEDIDFDDMTIHLKKVKNRRQQIVPLSPTLKSLLLKYLSTWQWDSTDYLFPTNQKEMMTVRSMQCAISRYNKSRGVIKTSCHLFRHYYAKHYILSGGQPLQLQALLGHSTLDMTKKYVNIYGIELQEGYEKFNPLDTLYQSKK